MQCVPHETRLAMTSGSRRRHRLLRSGSRIWRRSAKQALRIARSARRHWHLQSGAVLFWRGGLLLTVELCHSGRLAAAGPGALPGRRPKSPSVWHAGWRVGAVDQYSLPGNGDRRKNRRSSMRIPRNLFRKMLEGYYQRGGDVVSMTERLQTWSKELADVKSALEPRQKSTERRQPSGSEFDRLPITGTWSERRAAPR